MSNAALEKLAWVLIYSGLLLASIGAFVWRQQPLPGWILIGAGAVDAAIGALLIWLRSRRGG